MFLPSELEVKKSIVLNAERQLVEEKTQVFDYQKLANYTLEDVKWQFNNLDGELEVISIAKVVYGFSPVAKFCGLFDEEEIIENMQSKLDSFKLILEELPKIHETKVTKVLIDYDWWFLSIRDTINQKEVTNIHGKLYDEINQFMADNGIVANKEPLVIYHFWSDSLIDIEAGIPIDTVIKGNRRVKMGKIERGHAVTATHYGPYERLPETYYGINEWLRKNKVVVRGVPWEVYITDPTVETNPNNWKTAIYIPIK